MAPRRSFAPLNVSIKRPSPMLALSARPSRDWSIEYSEIRNGIQAKQYRDEFTAVYPRYLNLFDRLSDVHDEFLELSGKFKDAKGTPDYHVAAVQLYFDRLEADEHYMQTRKEHADLRAKLMVLKQRVDEWE